MRFQVVIAASVKMIAFWDIVPFSLVVADRRRIHHSDYARQYAPLKHQSTTTRLHGAISQNGSSGFFIIISYISQSLSL
jgi:hypothetical protein